MKGPPWLTSPIWVALCGVGSLVLAAILVLALLARNLGAERVAGTLENNTSAVASALCIQFERALALGIPLNTLVGVEPVLNEHLQRHQEVAFFALLAGDERPLVFSASPHLNGPEQALVSQQWGQGVLAAGAQSRFRVVRTPILSPESSNPNRTEGWLLSGYADNYIDQQVNAVVTDLFVAVLIALILVLEMLRFAGRQQGWGLLLQFKSFLHQVQRGQLSVHSPLADQSALGRLGHGMNHRIDALRQRVASALARAEPTERLGITADETGEAHTQQRTLRAWALRHGLLDPVRANVVRGDLASLRMVVFLTALSDELVRPFMAVHASQMNSPLALGPQAMAGIALSGFLLAWALSQPFGASLLQRHGPKRCLSGATAVVGLGLLATAFTTDWLLLTALRALTGAAFGFVLIFSQTLMLRLGRESGRAAAIAEFVGAVVAAGICGPAIGGLMAVKLGTTATLVASGLCALAALGLASQTASVPAPSHTGRPLSWASVGALLRHRRLLTLLVSSAIPGKLSATAVLLLIIPLAVVDLGESASLTGRLLLLYFLGFWLVAGWAGRLSDRWETPKAFVVTGGLISALGCAAGFAIGGVWGLVLLSSLLGLGQAWLSSPQIVWATQMADQDPQGTDSEVVLGIYRLAERLGGALGPLVVASVVGTQGLPQAMLWLGCLLLLGSGATALSPGATTPTRATPPNTSNTSSTANT